MTLQEYKDIHNLLLKDLMSSMKVGHEPLTRAMERNETSSVRILEWCKSKGIEMKEGVRRTPPTYNEKLPPESEKPTRIGYLLAHMAKVPSGRVAILAGDYTEFEKSAEDYDLTIEEENIYRRVYSWEKRGG